MEDLLCSLNEQIKRLDIFLSARKGRTTEEITEIGISNYVMCFSPHHLRKLTGSFKWRNNPQLQQHLEELKNGSNDVAKSCIKIGILSKDSLIDLSLLFSELLIQTQFTHSLFLRLVENCALSHCLMNWIVSSIRELMVQVKALVEHVRDHDQNGVTFLVGLVARVNDDSIQKLPASNKIALRRYILQSCTVTKDTVEEFRALLSESSEDDTLAKKEDHEKDEEEKDDEDEEDDCGYVSAEERAAVSVCVDLMAVALDVMKFALKAITTISDAICTGNGDTNEGLSSKVSFQFHANSLSRLFLLPHTEISRCGDRWIETVAQTVKEVEGDIVDLGAELYPPVDLTYTYPSTGRYYDNYPIWKFSC